MSAQWERIAADLSHLPAQNEKSKLSDTRVQPSIRAQLEQADCAGITVLGLFEVQNSRDYYTRPPKDASNPKPWEASRMVLELKLTDQCTYPLDEVNEIKELATTGSTTKPPREVLYAVLTVPDSRTPEQAPLRIACTLHLGGLIPWEMENTANCYELIEHAVELFSPQRKAGFADSGRVDFVFQGEPFYFTVAALPGGQGLLVVFDKHDCARGRTVV